MSDPISVGGIDITPFSSIDEAVSKVLPGKMEVKSGFWVAMNAEKLMEARHNTDSVRTIQKATLCYADGVAITWTMRLKGRRGVRIPGVELWEALMREAGRQSIPVFVIGATAEVNHRVVEKLRDQLSVQVVDSSDGYFEEEDALVDRVAASSAPIVTVALGSPRQEHFIDRCRQVHPSAFYLGVGGSYDVFVGAASRAPRWMRQWGLEWLFRLVKQPKRITRQRVYLKYMTLHFFGRL